MKICIMAAGAAGMICGSCVRDNALTLALRQLGHDAVLIPLYTPIRVDVADASSTPQVFLGGINVYLRHASTWFNRLPRFVHWLLDRPALLRAAGEMGAGTPPAELAELTKTVLRGAHGAMAEEVARLIEMLKTLEPDVISVPSMMFMGVVAALRRELKVPVIVELTGEDIFLEAMRPEDQREIQQLIRDQLDQASALVATSEYYAAKMAEYLGIPRQRITAVPPGIPQSMLAAQPHGIDGPPHLGHVARVAPEKGTDRVLAIAQRVAAKLPAARMHYAGYEGRLHRRWHASLRRRTAGVAEYHGEVDLPGKLALLDAAQVFIAPAPYAEPKGLYVLEALARGVPVIAADHGSFHEWITHTGGGVLVPPGDTDGFVRAAVELLQDPARRAALSESARAAIAANYLDRHMAQRMLEVYKQSS